ncbi:peroxiredoxin [Prevotella sp. KH2C16]|uniref:peroxiredoxin n=1 Tax=Prevotella sp. KH2C16 TaxID=1855325 RepID=UPI0008ED8D2E|nr:peroxiredoxin [Prevotella sp. KH2C16]SFG02948.1 peroxiredoxin Q/BCP [Prevotella sp. KH2C16]
MKQVGDRLPEILGRDQDGNEIRLSDFAGRKLVLYIYPKDSTPGCTNEACNLRDNYESFLAKGYAVVGASVQDEKSHKKFIEKYQLPFPLIADTEKRLVTELGVYGEKKMYGRTTMGTFRTTFIANEQGVIERILGPKDIKVKEHAEQILG